MTIALLTILRKKRRGGYNRLSLFGLCFCILLLLP